MPLLALGLAMLPLAQEWAQEECSKHPRRCLPPGWMLLLLNTQKGTCLLP